MPASPGAGRTIAQTCQIIDNEEVGDLSHVEDEGIASILRQAGTEASHASGIGWGHGRREGVGGAGWPAHLGGATNGYALASTLMFQAFPFAHSTGH